jgi:orotate phosphoribosyltransferase
MSKQEDLRQLLRAHAVKRGRFELASGRTSSYLVDVKAVSLTARGHALLGRILYELLPCDPFPKAVAGVELGGCSLASAVASESWGSSHPVDAVYVRKEPKRYGTGRYVEGGNMVRLSSKIPVVLFEDVVTTGYSAVCAATRLEYEGFEVVGVKAVVDRLEGAREEIEGNHGYPFASLFTPSDLGL